MSHAAERGLAGLFAAAAGFSADAAVLVHARMALAFLRAQAAGNGAGLQHPADDLLVRPRPAGGHGAGDGTDVGTVEIEADALRQLLHHVLAQAGIGTGRADLCAGAEEVAANHPRQVGQEVEV